jgi:serine/threonine protein kinase
MSREDSFLEDKGYLLLSKLGSGPVGEVWLAVGLDGVAVAVKILRRPLHGHDAEQRDLQGLGLLARLRHPFLLQVEVLSSQEWLYIITELAEGNLRDRLEQCRAEKQPGIPSAELITYFREAAEAVDFLHSQMIVHRDIKPENLLLVEGHVKVADFGLARLVETLGPMIAAGSGTPLHMAPEVWRGKPGPHSDQYGLATTYAELRLRRPAFACKDMVEFLFAHLERTPDLAPLAEAEQRVLLKALAKDPTQRYANCRTFTDALAAAVAAGSR